MDFSLQQLPEVLKPLLTVISGLMALLPPSFWGKIEPTKTERTLLGVFAAATVFFLWPVDLSYCRYLLLYIWLAAAFLAWFLLTLAADAIILRQFGHSQPYREDDLIVIKPVLGGPKLAPAGRELREQKPQWSTQQIFEHLDYDPLKTWERWPRTFLLVAERFCALSKMLAIILALVAFAAYFVLRSEISRTHRALAIEPSAEQLLLAGRSIAIEPKLQECRPDIRWDIEGLSSEKAVGALGEISQTGTYSAPSRIDRNIELYVVATPLEHPHERKKLKIRLHTHPDYSEPHDTEGKDIENRRARFSIEVIDQRYSWIIGKTSLNGAYGPAFVRRMAAEGMFSGFEDIICVGAASREYRSLSLEDRRALGRANVLGHWVRDAVPPGSARIHALKIGRYNDEERLTPAETARERQVVIVGVLPGSDKNVDLLDALRDAFEKKRAEEPLLGMYLDKYPLSNWELRRVNPVSG